MQISHSTITEYNLKLTESEMRAAIANPRQLAGILQTALDSGPENKNGGGDDEKVERKPRKSKKPTGIRNARNLFKVARKGKGHKKATGAGSPKETCAECGQQVAAKYINLHFRKKHPGVPAPAAKS